MHIFIDRFNFWPSKKDNKHAQIEKLSAYDCALSAQADNVWRAIGSDGYSSVLKIVHDNAGPNSISFENALVRFISNDVNSRISKRDRWLFNPELGMGARNLDFLHDYCEWVASGILTGRIRHYFGWLGEGSKLWRNQIKSIRALSKSLFDLSLADVKYDPKHD